jgi:hypothetical protein
MKAVKARRVMGMSINFCKIICVVAIFMLGGVAWASAQEDQKQSLKIYGQAFTVTPFQMEGTAITFDNIKPYITEIYPSIGTRKMSTKDVETFLMSRNIFYSRLFESSLNDAAAKIVKYVPTNQRSALQTQTQAQGDIEFPDYVIQDVGMMVSQGRWEQAVAKYKPFDASLEPQLFSLQKLKYSQLAAAYLSGLVSNSDEINALYE